MSSTPLFKKIFDHIANFTTLDRYELNSKHIANTYEEANAKGKVHEIPFFTYDGIPFYLSHYKLNLAYEFFERAQLEAQRKFKNLELTKTFATQSLLGIETFFSQRLANLNPNIKTIMTILKNPLNHGEQPSAELNHYLASDHVLGTKRMRHEDWYVVYQTLAWNLELEKQQVLDGFPYRKRSLRTSSLVDVMGSSEIYAAMEQIFDFYNRTPPTKNHVYAVPLLCYFYRFITPYYTFNRRSGRLLTLGYVFKHDWVQEFCPLNLAMYNFRELYEGALKKSQKFPNDASYFVNAFLCIIAMQKITNLFVKNLLTNSNASLTFTKFDILKNYLLMRLFLHDDYLTLDKLDGIGPEWQEKITLQLANLVEDELVVTKNGAYKINQDHPSYQREYVYFEKLIQDVFA